MGVDRLEVLHNIYDSLLQDRKDEDEKLNDNLNRIREIDVFLESVKDDPESDFRVFSPRSSESIYRGEIEQHKNEKSNLEIENRSHYSKINKLNRWIQELELLIQDISSINIEDQKVLPEDKKVLPDDENRHIWMLDIQEKERQRIARELHDSSVQNLTHLIHTIELSSMFIDQDPIRAKLELASCSKNLKSVIDEMREIIFNLRPMSFDDLGFKQSIEDFINNLKLKFDTDCKIDYNICEININNWDKEKKQFDLILVTMYRVIQESLMNALKYSGADQISLSVNVTNHSFFVNIKDNGKGFSLDQVLEHKDRHFGISVMKERVYLLNGDISIETEPGRGTEIKIEIPLI